MRAINRVRAAGSIAAAVRRGSSPTASCMPASCSNVPFVLTGSIRDDGPLPDVITDAIAGQDAMKRYTTRATMAVLIATALHAIATGNMLPAFVTEPDGSLRELTTICVDSSEFVVSKLEGPGHAPGLRGGDECAGLHAHPPPLRRARARRARARREPRTAGPAGGCRPMTSVAPGRREASGMSDSCGRLRTGFRPHAWWRFTCSRLSGRGRWRAG